MITEDQAIDILEAAHSGGYMDGNMPGDSEETVQLGEYYLAEARKAIDAGMKDEAIEKIVEIGGGESDAGADAVVDKSPVDSPDEPVDDPDPAETEGTVSRETRGSPSRGRPDVGEASSPLGENLPVPAEIEGDVAEMPRDLTKLSDRQLRRLHGEYNACLSRVTWLIAIESSDLANAMHMREHAFNKALKKLERLDPETDKPKLKIVLDAEAFDDPEWIDWDKKFRKHETKLKMLKSLKEIYASNVDRLSRDWTMRSEEWQRSGGKG
jgi:hypothetical protein